MGYCKFMDDLPYIVKILFCLPVIDILWAIYRIVKGVCKGHIVTLIAGIIWLLPAPRSVGSSTLSLRSFT